MDQGSFKMLDNAPTTWIKFLINEKGVMHQIRCKICTSIEGKEKLLAPKLDNLLKIVGQWKCLVSQLGVYVGSYYFNKNLVHMKNEHVYIINFCISILTNSKLMSLLITNKKMCSLL
jgi:hypothetical protein